MKQYLTLPAIALIALSLPFTILYGPPYSKVPTGIYGIQGHTSCEVELSIQKDHRFYYINTPEDIDVKGTWTLENKTLHFSDYSPDVRIPEKWKVIQDGQCLRSKMTNFQVTRLCLLKECE